MCSSEVAQIAHELKTNKELRQLMTEALDASPEAIKAAHDFLAGRKRNARK